MNILPLNEKSLRVEPGGFFLHPASLPQPLYTVVQKIRMFSALGMYQAGEYAIGAACVLAGVDRYVFLDFSKREGVQVQTQTPDELEAEFKKA